MRVEVVGQAARLRSTGVCGWSVADSAARSSHKGHVVTGHTVMWVTCIVPFEIRRLQTCHARRSSENNHPSCSVAMRRCMMSAISGACASCINGRCGARSETRPGLRSAPGWPNVARRARNRPESQAPNTEHRTPNTEHRTPSIEPRSQPGSQDRSDYVPPTRS